MRLFRTYLFKGPFFHFRLTSSIPPNNAPGIPPTRGRTYTAPPRQSFARSDLTLNSRMAAGTKRAYHTVKYENSECQSLAQYPKFPDKNRKSSQRKSRGSPLASLGLTDASLRTPTPAKLPATARGLRIAGASHIAGTRCRGERARPRRQNEDYALFDPSCASKLAPTGESPSSRVLCAGGLSPPARSRSRSAPGWSPGAAGWLASWRGR